MFFKSNQGKQGPSACTVKLLFQKVPASSGTWVSSHCSCRFPLCTSPRALREQDRKPPSRRYYRCVLFVHQGLFQVLRQTPYNLHKTTNAYQGLPVSRRTDRPARAPAVSGKVRPGATTQPASDAHQPLGAAPPLHLQARQEAATQVPSSPTPARPGR